MFTFVANSAASPSTSAKSSRSSTLGSGLSTRSGTTSESDAEVAALDNVRVVARLVIFFRMFTFRQCLGCLIINIVVTVALFNILYLIWFSDLSKMARIASVFAQFISDNRVN